MELIASGIAKAKRSLWFQKLLLSFLSYGCWQERSTSILIYYIGLIKWGRVDGRLLQNQMVQVGLLCFQHFPSLVLKVQTKAVLQILGLFPWTFSPYLTQFRLPLVPEQAHLRPRAGGFLCPSAPSSCKVSFPLSVLVVLEANWGTMSFSDCLDPNKRSFLLLLNLPSQFSFPVFPKKQRPETSKF